MASWHGNGALQDKPKLHLVRCPVHGQRVVLDGHGRVIGICTACMEEAARAIRKFQ